MAQWHPTRNDAGEDPSGIRAGLKEPRWWQCPVDATHEWEATVAGRTRADGTCPFCTNRRVCRTNSLARLFPDVAALWHPADNGALTPNDVLPGSAQEVAWLCPRGHTFRKAVTFMRTVRQPCEQCRALGPLPAATAPEWDDLGLLDPRDEDDEDF